MIPAPRDVPTARPSAGPEPPQDAPAGRPEPPALSLPPAGGAVRGLGEKFRAAAATGTESLSVPVPASPGRSGFGPELALTYDSGNGNGPFGLGWELPLPAVTRKTDLGLPRYDDPAESDVFLLSGAEDLVPALDAAGERVTLDEPAGAAGYRVDRYRPRVEHGFARVERWTRKADGDVHWRTVTGENVTSRYGVDAGSRVADPDDPRRVFGWLLCDSRDDKGNLVVYEYKAEDSAGVDLASAHERNRTAAGRGANRYLKRVRYGNRVSWLAEPDADPDRREWMFELVFDYGDHDPDTPAPAEQRVWPVRADPFSRYRAGFEIRTYRLCRRILMFHHFPDAPAVGTGCLVRSLDLGYQEEPGGSLLVSLTSAGYRRGGGYLRRALPPLELGYQPLEFSAQVHEADPDSLAHLPAGVGAGNQWVDLDGEGLSGVLTTQAGGWYYQRNLGGGRLAPAEPVARQPALAARIPRLADLDGDGRLHLVDLDGPTPGYLTRTGDGDWTPFAPFASLPVVDWDDPNLRFVDLTGDGRTDLLVTEEEALSWYASRGAGGFGPARRQGTPGDDERGPRLVFADGTGSTYLADLSGDGLADLVRVRNGSVCYWPNLGYGRFGAKTTMDGAPTFDREDLFDQRRVRLADVDGTGAVDLIYLDRDGVRVWRNLSGNRWGDPARLPFPPVDDVAAVAAVDLLGTGTACLVWSSPLPGAAGRQLRYLDLTGGRKPHLLVEIRNNLGARTRIDYTPSTRFYLADRAAGRPWATRLPFPVQVVERVTTVDEISRNRFVTRYAYHHGYFDPAERELRGFALVEQTDTEELALLGGEPADGPAANEDPASHVPPVLTRTWFHTGAPDPAGHVSRQLAAEYDAGPGALPDSTVPSGLSADEVREGCRALKGSVLRQEVYARDGGTAEGRPYQVVERNYTVAAVQRRGGNRHAVFFVHDRESVTVHLERGDDPRVGHELTLAVDRYGNVLRSASVGYGRQVPDPDAGAAQSATHVVVTEQDYTRPVDETGSVSAYRTPLPCQTRRYQLGGVAPAADRFGFAELAAAAAELPEVPPEQVDATGGHRRLLSHERTLYRRDDLTGALPLGELEPLALPHQSYRLAFTRGLVAAAYGDRVDGAALTEAGYLDDDAGWWLPTGQQFYTAEAAAPAAEAAAGRAHFFLPHRLVDTFGNATTVTYDEHALLVREMVDPLGNRVTAGGRDASGRLVEDGNDYRVLRPWLLTDPNRNRTAVAFDALGQVVGTAVMGKPQQGLGDTLTGFTADIPEETVAAFLADPVARAPQLLGGATSRLVHDPAAFWRTRDEPAPQPPVVATLARETHLADGGDTRIQLDFGYSDGFGREIQRKARAAPGPDGAPRWVGTGWTVLNNKGNPVRQFEPFFSADHGFEFGREVGVSPVLWYDPLERLVATLHPDGSYEKVVFDPWHQARWDGNDTVLLDPRTDPDTRGYVAGYAATLPPKWQTWHRQRTTGAAGAADRDAAAKAAAHAGTPTVVHFDGLGRPVATVAHNRYQRDGATVEERHTERVVLDVDGNEREVVDALGRVAARYGYDLLGNRVHEASMEAGSRWTLLDAAGNPVRSWDSRGHQTFTRYDALRRPTGTFLRVDGGPEALVERVVYGEEVSDPEARNLRGEVAQVFDQAGVVADEEYDVKGNLLHSTRRLARDYRSTLDWSGEVMLTEAVYHSESRFDALDRPVALTTPDGSVVEPSYDEAGLLQAVSGRVRGAAEVTRFVTAIEYDARGQRTAVVCGNGTRTVYDYDPATFRLVRLRTGEAQDLRYTYDPVGNVTRIRDDAQQTVFFANQVVEPHADYTYDAVYRLVEAHGREHLADGVPVPPGAGGAPIAGLPHPADGSALGRYVQRYAYDASGNILELAHRGSHPAHPGWTRTYRYAEPSLLAPGQVSNRLSSLTVGGDASRPFAYDGHGNTRSMPGLPVLRWDHRDQLAATARQVAGDGATPETTSYRYDAAGERVRKVTDRQAPAGATPTRRAERIYLGGLELYREYGGDGETVTLARETLHIMDDEQRIALVETRTAGTDPGERQLVRYQLGNHLGSASLELDGDGRVISYEEFYPYGATAYEAARSQTQTPKRYRYTGKERDSETGLAHHGARYYAPWVGRWTSPDPAGLADGPNRYVYSTNRPVILLDPDGTQAEPPPDEKARARQQAGGQFRRMLGGFIAGFALPPTALQVLRRGPSNVHYAGQDTQRLLEEQNERLAQRANVAMEHMGFWMNVASSILGLIEFGAGAAAQIRGLRRAFLRPVVRAITATRASGQVSTPLARTKSTGISEIPQGYQANTVADVPGKLKSASAIETARFHASARRGLEYHTAREAGSRSPITILGQAKKVGWPDFKNPIVFSQHTHPQSWTAQFSEKDIRAFLRMGGKGKTLPMTEYSVLGYRFPNANRFLEKEGLSLDPSVVKYIIRHFEIQKYWRTPIPTRRVPWLP